uniref:Uncharacterized protein n=1 Tax=Glossina austeni TaxID=7395 RepID=A0A1A9V215_GLOAU
MRTLTYFEFNIITNPQLNHNINFANGICASICNICNIALYGVELLLIRLFDSMYLVLLKALMGRKYNAKLTAVRYFPSDQLPTVTHNQISCDILIHRWHLQRVHKFYKLLPLTDAMILKERNTH